MTNQKFAGIRESVKKQLAEWFEKEEKNRFVSKDEINDHSRPKDFCEMLKSVRCSKFWRYVLMGNRWKSMGNLIQDLFH